MADDGEKRYSARLNMDYQVSKLLKLESGMSYEKQDITTPSTDVGAGYYDFWVWPYYNEKGQFYDTFGNRNVIGGLVGGGQVKTENIRFRGNMKATFDFSQWVQGLSVSASGAYKFSQTGKQTSKNVIRYYDWVGNEVFQRQNPSKLEEETKNMKTITWEFLQTTTVRSMILIMYLPCWV